MTLNYTPSRVLNPHSIGNLTLKIADLLDSPFPLNMTVSDCRASSHSALTLLCSVTHCGSFPQSFSAQTLLANQLAANREGERNAAAPSNFTSAAAITADLA
jgi:hypothetical protein